MTFQLGNQLAVGGRKDKPFRDALLLAINGADGDKAKLRRVAEKLVSVAAKGNVPAIKELADRLDGKVPQALIADDDGSPMVLQVVRYVVAPTEQQQVIDVTAQSTIEPSSDVVTSNVTTEQDQ